MKSVPVIQFDMQVKTGKKYGVSIRLDEESIEIAKAYGSGYTSLLAKIIYLGIRDPEILSKAVKQLEP